METQEWITVYTLTNPVTAEIIKNSLLAEGIRCNLEGMNQAAGVGLVPGSIQVQTAAEHADLARKIVLKHEQHVAVGKQYEKR